ncbi:hypothetical protein NW761_014943 [Fusarium oxysporum]|nr:hypothetical protein NW758_014986 [Fusarium oxysporum]KAJ4072429.1 hypothetical protein NW761_014943 [Fusarium oxysporum]
MEAVPLQTLPANSNSRAAPAISGNMSDLYSTVAHNNEEPNYPAEAASENPGPDLTNTCQPGCFVPLSDEDMAQHPELPELDFRPLALEFWYLMSLMIWFVLCFFGVSALAVFGQTQPSWFHLESRYGYNLWLYSPGIVGFLTTVLWRGTLQSYNRIIPYVRMANLPLSQDSNGNSSNARPSFLNVPLTGIPGGTVNFGALVTLWKSGDYLSFVVNLSVVFTILLTPIKSGIFQLVKDTSGWRIRVSILFCITAMLIYLWLFVVTIAITLHLRKNRTGLKWNPSTLAAQLALIQGSNIFYKFKDISTEQPRPLDLAIAEWPQEGLILRLGYWKEQGTNVIIHGVRFLPRSTPHRIYQVSDLEPVSRSENVTYEPFRMQSAGIIVDRNQNQCNGESISLTEANYDNGWRATPITEPAVAIGRATSMRYESTSSLQQRDPQPDVDRIWNYALFDSYLLAITLVGTAALTAAIVAWVRGDIYRPFNFPLRHIAYASSKTNAIPVLIRGIIFSLLPDALFGIFNNTILAADIYQRSMVPVQNMAKSLPDNDRKRLCPGEAEIKGATAHDSMLLDYISPDLVSCIVTATSAGHYKIILGTILATLCNSVYIVVGRLFVFGEGDDSGYTVRVQPHNFYAAFSIMIVYCISIWILRPRGAIRTCRRIFTLMDFGMLIHQSHILKCPEFWLQNVSDTEDHMKSQVMLANRLYRFGVYAGMDTHDYVGISICEVPTAWTLNPDDITCLHYSTQLAKDALTFGIYDSSSLLFTQNFLMGGPRTWSKHKRVYSNDYRSWSRRARKLVGRTSKVDSEAELGYHPGNENGCDVAEGQSSSYQRPSICSRGSSWTGTGTRAGRTIQT